MSAILSQEENNTATTDLVENAGKQIVAVTGNVLGGDRAQKPLIG